MSGVILSNVTKRYGAFVSVNDVSCEIRDGEFMTLLGPSGCGKTTTLRLVAGLINPEQGRIMIGGRDVTKVRPEHRRIGMVFQDYALFPHLTVAENIAFGLRERKTPAAEQARRVEEMLTLVRLPEQAAKFPHQLSGGQRQRVALARALAFPPEVLLMDEPLGALDLKLRQTMQLELTRIQRKLKITTIYVTHDQEEALNLSDRIAVMDRGEIVQLGTGPEVYGRPATPFIADFLGRVNFLPGRFRGREGTTAVVECDTAVFRVPHFVAPEGTPLKIGVRPERMRLCTSPPEAGQPALRGTIESATYAGNLVRYYVRCLDDVLVMIEQQAQQTILLSEGQSAWVEWDQDAVMAWPEPAKAD
jgi:spermidine/putrescine ABC transporter ATP-binding subunit